ncbi:hypothetical protein HFN_1377 [Helicobacter fennelliae MRY12-0050]|uniref:Uncharacterized protein n=1 Tax=Helicobacter fennelliae MRY12-0050 TaxID=1325130 RepID=T1DX16_9HELI|nr:hypothetical protein HFN_1377 [Helicobacter fennelliae MRY12-0050]
MELSSQLLSMLKIIVVLVFSVASGSVEVRLFWYYTQSK